ncbi:MAG: replication-associated recombination protein A [Bdellovibrionales bacterium]
MLEKAPMEDLFKASFDKRLQPLAEQMRPKSIEDILGQIELSGDSSAIVKLLRAKKLPNLILWGPPGTGKTSFAKLIGNYYDSAVDNLNAISTGAKDLREIGMQAENNFYSNGEKRILFIDEFHRLNKTQQDVLLPFMELGCVLLIGATTENPGFEVNSALLSRSRVVRFENLSASALEKLFEKALDFKRLSREQVFSDKGNALTYFLSLSGGDARKLIGLSEQLFDLYEVESVSSGNQSPFPIIDEKGLRSLLPAMDLYYDKKDSHYDIASAFIKSIRGSSPDAAIYYLARMIRSGEDPKFIARRLVISASEDVGNADPRALTIAVAAMQAVEFVGLPEAGINLAQATTYLASCPKSNKSYAAFNAAMAEVEKSGTLTIPLTLKNAANSFLKKIGYGKGYKYAFNGERNYQAMDFLPAEIKDREFYSPDEIGFEKNIKAYLKWVRAED